MVLWWPPTRSHPHLESRPQGTTERIRVFIVGCRSLKASVDLAGENRLAQEGCRRTRLAFALLESRRFSDAQCWISHRRTLIRNLKMLSILSHLWHLWICVTDEPVSNSDG